MLTAKLWPCLLTTLYLALGNVVHAGEQPVPGRADRGIRAGIDVDINSVFNIYRTAYPEINFVHLSNQSEAAQIVPLLRALGSKAENVDYAHPKEARITLLQVQIERIRRLLEDRLPSATLFKAGNGDLVAAKPYLCVVTFNADLLSGDPQAATRFFFEELIPGSNVRIDNEQFLHFALHHEIFHCLDAYINGPTRPQTESEITASYYDYRAEQRADFFAAIMHQARYPKSSMLQHLSAIRAMSLVTWDLPHYTVPLLQEARAMLPSAIRALGLAGQARLAMARADTILISERQYRDFVAAAVEVSLSQGKGEGAFSPMFRELVSENRKADPALVAALESAVRGARRDLSLTQLSSN